MKSAKVPSHVDRPVMSRRIRTSGSRSAASSPGRRNEAVTSGLGETGSAAGQTASRVAAWRPISRAPWTSCRVRTNGASGRVSRSASTHPTGSLWARRNSTASGSRSVPWRLTNAKSSSRIRAPLQSAGQITFVAPRRPPEKIKGRAVNPVRAPRSRRNAVPSDGESRESDPRSSEPVP